MTRYLTIHHPDAADDPYPIETDGDLREAIEQEADIVASDAGAELLESPEQHYRDELSRQIQTDAHAALTGPDAEYRDPAGIRWTLDAGPDYRPA